MEKRSSNSCPSCGAEVRPTGATVIGSGFPMRDFDTETAVCSNCGLPLRRGVGQPWIWAGDWPPWVMTAERAERWDAAAYQEWETLRDRCAELGIQIEPTDPGITGIAAYGTSPSFVAEPVNPEDEQPVLEALNRLVVKVATAQRERQ